MGVRESALFSHPKCIFYNSTNYWCILCIISSAFILACNNISSDSDSLCSYSSMACSIILIAQIYPSPTLSNLNIACNVVEIAATTDIKF